MSYPIKGRSKVGLWFGILGIPIFVFLGGASWLYARLSAPSVEEYNQLEHVIRTHDIAAIQQLSEDQATQNFLLRLPKDATLSVSDFQGGGPIAPSLVMGYFPASVNGHFLDTYMVKKSGFEFIPHWTLVKISVKPVSMKDIPVNPDWEKN